MDLADNLEHERAALTMIHSQPFNAEAPPKHSKPIPPRRRRITSAASASPFPTTMAVSRSAARSGGPTRSRSTI